MALPTHRLLGFSRPVVKDGAVYVPVRLGDGMVALAGSTGVMVDLARAILGECGPQLQQPADPYAAAAHSLQVDPSRTIANVAEQYHLQPGALAVWLSARPVATPPKRPKPAGARLGRPRTPISAKLEAKFRLIRRQWEAGEGTQRALCRFHEVSTVGFIKWLQRERAQERAERIAGTAPVLKPGGKLL